MLHFSTPYYHILQRCYSLPAYAALHSFMIKIFPSFPDIKYTYKPLIVFSSLSSIWTVNSRRHKSSVYQILTTLNLCLSWGLFHFHFSVFFHSYLCVCLNHIYWLVFQYISYSMRFHTSNEANHYMLYRVCLLYTSRCV